MLAATSAVAASVGVLAPFLTDWTSRGARAGRGLQIGRQTAAVSLGGAGRAAMGGLLHGLPSLPHAPSVVMAALTGAAVLVGFGPSSALGREGGFSVARPGGSGAVYRGRGERDPDSETRLGSTPSARGGSPRRPRTIASNLSSSACQAGV